MQTGPPTKAMSTKNQISKTSIELDYTKLDHGNNKPAHPSHLGTKALNNM